MNFCARCGDALSYTTHICATKFYGDPNANVYQEKQTPSQQRITHLESEVAKWKRLYENTIVQKEGMQLYAELDKLKARLIMLELIVKQGVWPK